MIYRFGQVLMAGVVGMELLQAADPVVHVPLTGMVQWLIVALLGIVLYMLRDLHQRATKWQESLDLRVRALEEASIKHGERLNMFPFMARLDEAIDHRHRRDAEATGHQHHRKEES
jgi:hypothetical protein